MSYRTKGEKDGGGGLHGTDEFGVARLDVAGAVRLGDEPCLENCAPQRSFEVREVASKRHDRRAQILRGSAALRPSKRVMIPVDPSRRGVEEEEEEGPPSRTNPLEYESRERYSA